MVAFIIRRIVLSIIVLFLVSILTFLLIHLLPGDPALIMLGMDAPEEELKALRQELWLDKPLLMQYGHWLGRLLQGDMGESLFYRQDVADVIAQRLPVTIYLSLISFVLSTVLGIIFGIISAIRRGKPVDTVITLFANIGVAIPVFWLGILMIYILGMQLRLLPIQGYTSPLVNPLMSLKQAIMPVICMSLYGLAVTARQTRSSMLEVIGQDYIRTAWSKGLKERIVILKHALKNAMIPVITLLGMLFRVVVGGIVLIETVFNIPGMGRLMVDSVFNKDFITVQGCTLVIAIVVLLVNLIVDISYGWFDPRIRYE